MLGVSIAMLGDFLLGWSVGEARDGLDAFSRGFWLGLVGGPLLLIATALIADSAYPWILLGGPLLPLLMGHIPNGASLRVLFSTDELSVLTFALSAVVGAVGALAHLWLTRWSRQRRA